MPTQTRYMSDVEFRDYIIENYGARPFIITYVFEGVTATMTVEAYTPGEAKMTADKKLPEGSKIVLVASDQSWWRESLITEEDCDYQCESDLQLYGGYGYGNLWY